MPRSGVGADSVRSSNKRIGSAVSSGGRRHSAASEFSAGKSFASRQVSRSSFGELFNHIPDKTREAREKQSPELRRLYSKARIYENLFEHRFTGEGYEVEQQRRYDEALQGLEKMLEDPAAKGKKPDERQQKKIDELAAAIKEDSTLQPKCMRLKIHCLAPENMEQLDPEEKTKVETKIMKEIDTELGKYRNVGHQYGEAMMLLTKSEMARRCGFDDGSTKPHENICEWCTKAALIFNDNYDQRLEAAAYMEKGYAMLGRGDAEAVYQAAIKAMSLFVEHGDKGGQVHAFYLLSTAYFIRNDFDKALLQASRGLEIAKWLQNSKLVNMQANLMRSIYQKKKELEEFLDISYDIEDYDGLWRRKGDGEDIALIVTNTLLWLTGSDKLCRIEVQRDDEGKTELSYFQNRGEEIIGKLSIPEAEMKAKDHIEVLDDIVSDHTDRQMIQKGDKGQVWSMNDDSAQVLFDGRQKPVSVRKQSFGAFNVLPQIHWDNGEVWWMTQKRQTKDRGRRKSQESRRSTAPPFHAKQKIYTLEEVEDVRTNFLSKKGAMAVFEQLKRAGWDLRSHSFSDMSSRSISDLGLTSTQFLLARELLSKHFKTNLSMEVLLDLQTIGDLCDYVLGNRN